MKSAKVIAGVARLVRDLAVAEELAQDAFVLALEEWPRQGMPRHPGAWLMAIAKNRAIDFLRRGLLMQRKHQELGDELEQRERAEPDKDGGDDLLRLMFVTCHPVLKREARVALTLRLLGGLSTEEIARAFLTPPATIAQRIVRARRRLPESRSRSKCP